MLIFNFFSCFNSYDYLISLVVFNSYDYLISLVVFNSYDYLISLVVFNSYDYLISSFKSIKMPFLPSNSPIPVIAIFSMPTSL